MIDLSRACREETETTKSLVEKDKLTWSVAEQGRGWCEYVCLSLSERIGAHVVELYKSPAETKERLWSLKGSPAWWEAGEGVNLSMWQGTFLPR